MIVWPVVTSKAMENPTAITTPSGENVPMPNPPISEQSVTVQIQSATVPSAVPATAAAHHGYLLVVAVVVAVASQHNIMIDGCPLTILLYCVVSLQSTNCSSSSSTAEACPRTESRGCATLSRPGEVPMLPPPVIQHMWLCGGLMLSRPPPLILPSLTVTYHYQYHHQCHHHYYHTCLVYLSGEDGVLRQAADLQRVPRHNEELQSAIVR